MAVVIVEEMTTVVMGDHSDEKVQTNLVTVGVGKRPSQLA